MHRGTCQIRHRRAARARAASRAATAAQDKAANQNKLGWSRNSNSATTHMARPDVRARATWVDVPEGSDFTIYNCQVVFRASKLIIFVSTRMVMWIIPNRTYAKKQR